MIWLAVGLGILAFSVLVAVLSMLLPSKAEAPLDPEAEIQAAVELHRIGRQLDADWTKTELRRDADALEHRIAETIDSDDGP